METICTLYFDDVSPICVHTNATILHKDLKGWFIGEKQTSEFTGWLSGCMSRSYQTKKNVNYRCCWIPYGTVLKTIAAMLCNRLRHFARVQRRERPGWDASYCIGQVLPGSPPRLFLWRWWSLIFFWYWLHPFTEVKGLTHQAGLTLMK